MSEVSTSEPDDLRFTAAGNILRAEAVMGPVCAELGVGLLGCELGSEGSKPALRVFIDKEGGTTITDCVGVHRAVTDLLDAEDLFPSSWVLQVSSPGFDRPLFTRRHLAAQLGKLVKIRCKLGVDGRKRFRGLLQAIDERGCTVQLDDGQVFDLSLDDVEKAHLVWEGDGT